MKKLDDRNIAALAVLLSLILGGAGTVYIKVGTLATSPEVFTFARFFISSLVLLPFFIKKGIKFNKDLINLILVSLFSTANILLFAYGLRLTTASIGQTLYIFSPAIVCMLSYFLLGEKISYRKLSGILFGFIGALFIVLLPVIEKGSAFSGNITGNLLIALGSVSFSFYSVLSKKLHAKFSPIQFAMVFSLTTMFSMIIINSQSILNFVNHLDELNSQTIFAIIYVGTFGTAATYALYQYSIKHGSPLIASTMLYLQPVTTIIAASILLGERVTPGFILGAILAAVGTYLIVRSR